MRLKVVLDEECGEMLQEIREKTHQKTSQITASALKRGLYGLLRETRVAWMVRDHD